MTTTDEYVPSMDALLDHYEELSLTVSRDPEVAKENRRIAEKSLARVRRDVEAELDSWMARAYEAEKRAWQAEQRVKAVRDLCDDADKHHASVLIVTKVRRALDT